MMNHARLNVGLEGIAVSEAAYQKAAAYARERVQGTPIGGTKRASIIHHPDVRRMLMDMRARTEAMRALGLLHGRLHGPRAASSGPSRTGPQPGPRRTAHPGRQGMVHRERDHDRLHRHSGAWRRRVLEETGAAQYRAMRPSPRSTKARQAFRRTT